jgi:hypothetical protein
VRRSRRIHKGIHLGICALRCAGHASPTIALSLGLEEVLHCCCRRIVYQFASPGPKRSNHIHHNENTHSIADSLRVRVPFALFIPSTSPVNQTPSHLQTGSLVRLQHGAQRLSPARYRATKLLLARPTAQFLDTHHARHRRRAHRRLCHVHQYPTNARWAGDSLVSFPAPHT